MMNKGLHVVLVEPEIPPNTGNIARLCAATFTPLHLVGPLGFKMDEKNLKRAGVDYWEHVQVEKWDSLDELREKKKEGRFIYFSTKAETLFTDFSFREGDYLVFGRETKGLPQSLLKENWERVVKIPMESPHVRSLNLATSVGIGLFEARKT